MKMVAARPAPTPSSLLLPHDMASVAVARRSLSRDLARCGASEDVVDDAVLVVSELMTNALRHARPLIADMIRLEWSVAEGRLELSVTDGGGPTAPMRAQPSVTARGGRGLAIISSLASSWGVRRRTGETTVWALLPLLPENPGGRSFASHNDLPAGRPHR